MLFDEALVTQDGGVVAVVLLAGQAAPRGRFTAVFTVSNAKTGGPARDRVADPACETHAHPHYQEYDIFHKNKHHVSTLAVDGN